MFIKSKSYIYYPLTIISIIYCITKVYNYKYFTFSIFSEDKISYSSSSYGHYLSGYYLIKHNDLDKASDHLLSSYTKSQDQNILQNYFISLLLSGHIETAIEISDKSNKDIFLIDLIKILKLVKELNYSDTIAKIKHIHLNDINKFILSIIEIWCDISLKNYKNLDSKFDNLNIDSEKYNMFKFQQALIFYLVGNIKLAEESFDELFLDMQPIHYIEYGISFYNKIGRTNKAVELNHKYNLKLKYLNQLTLDARSAIAILLSDISSILYNSHYISQGLIYAQLSHYLDSESDYIKYILASYYYKIENYESANLYFEKIKKTSSKYYNALVNIAAGYYKQDRKQKSIKILKQITMDSIQALILLAEIYQNEKFYDNSINLINKYIENYKQDNDLWYLYFIMASSYQANGDFKRAKENYLKSYNISPNNPLILNNLAYSMVEDDENFEAALEMITKTREISPDNPQFLDTMGWVLYKLNDFEKSYIYLEKAANLLPYDEIINEHLGDLYWKLGDKNNARFIWQHAIESSNEPQIKEKLIMKIKNGI